MGLRARSIDRSQYPHPDTVMVPLVLTSTGTYARDCYHGTNTFFNDAVVGDRVTLNSDWEGWNPCTPQSISFDGVGSSPSGAIDAKALIYGENQFGESITELHHFTNAGLLQTPNGLDGWGTKIFRRVTAIEWVDLTAAPDNVSMNIGVHAGGVAPDGGTAYTNARFGVPFRLSEPGIGGASTPEPTAEILEVINVPTMSVNPYWKIDTENHSIYMNNFTGYTGGTLFLKMRVPFKRDM